MVDMTALSALHGSDESARRLRKRRSAETRLRIYGIIAILMAFLALVALLNSVVGKAVGALTESYVSIPVTLDPAKIDPDGTRDAKTIGRADFVGMTKRALRDRFPNVKDRKSRRALNDLISAGAAYELREQVMANPDLIGTTINARLLASDVTDLYTKGSYGELVDEPVSGNLTLQEDGKVVKLASSSDDFLAALQYIKAELFSRAELERRQIGLQKNGIAEYERRLAAAQTDKDREAAEKQITARKALREQLIAKADDLETRAQDPRSAEPLDRTVPSFLIKAAGGWLKLTSVGAQSGEGIWLSPPTAPIEGLTEWTLYRTELAENARKISDAHVVWIETLEEEGAVETVFNWRFFTSGDSREPELAGIWGAAVGSFWTMLVTFFLSFPIGVLAAIYLEEFAPKNRVTDFIEVNINNLAAVPSIVFGLLGLSIFLGVFGVPRSAPLAGGIVLALMTLPTIIIASRAAIRAVPPSIRDAALGLGASKLQTSFHHVLPLAMPGILTGTIIGMAQALGETAPLIMIGMVAFIVDIPGGITDSASVLPVQVFRWSDFPERAFEARTAAAICVLIVFLIAMNAFAVFLRKRFERRW